jgi:hypothetical protein
MERCKVLELSRMERKVASGEKSQEAGSNSLKNLVLGKQRHKETKKAKQMHKVNMHPLTI